jgi:hypothetical protein
MEAGPDGAEVIAFGAPFTENKDAQLEHGWWPEHGEQPADLDQPADGA